MNKVKNKLLKSLLYFLVSVISIILLIIVSISENEIFNVLGIIIFSFLSVLFFSLSFLYLVDHFKKDKNIENIKIKKAPIKEDVYLQEKQSKLDEFLEIIYGLFMIAIILGIIFVFGIVILAIVKWSFAIVF
ncbi:MAG: hypothetical protein US36_C0006G0010 [Candidatus Wolfebacteria bacterium GW2011_GWC1_37_10]|uniref:DUF3899 domain-containing protein n=1 Tax=Candidatus Wolfebacteria bacterium GW2011_GWC1_37_10 TaxID=1619010 RepID=A0A0G0J418_9BACT|nr:MAG: hypothetical protein US36_C0006G0010 [Candidatus Wolfebacteria bacterium GW2011_GWC1_37_10]